MPMIHTIEFDGEVYPFFQASGKAMRFCLPFAQEVCKGKGVDVGCNRHEWCFPGAHPIDPVIYPQFNAMNFPENEKDLDYIFSSHCLEHLDRWVDVLDYWTSKLKPGGVLFLYLPDFSQIYWRPFYNRKHVSVFTPEIIRAYFKTKFVNIFVSGVDLNNSFCAMGEKR